MCLLGRHALPHIFHKQGFCRLMAACRWAVAPISMERLPSHYPVHMYNAVGGNAAMECAHSTTMALGHEASEFAGGVYASEFLGHTGTSSTLTVSPTNCGWMDGAGQFCPGCGYHLSVLIHLSTQS